MTGASRLFGRLLLRCYPRAWRRRYRAELLDLLAETGVTPRTAADVAAAGLRLRAHAVDTAIQGGIAMTIGPAWRHPTAFATAAAVLLLPTFLVVAASLLAYELDLRQVRAVIEPVMDALARWRTIDVLLVGAPPLAAVAALAPLVRLGLERREGTIHTVITVRALALNVLVGLMALALGALLVWHIVVESVLRVGA
jgi:hypothetical protein